MLTPEQYAVCLAMVLGASVIQGATGFGFGMTLTAVLPFVLDAKLAVVFTAVLAPILCAWLLWPVREHAALKPVLIVLAGSILVGLPIGTYIYAVSQTWVFKQVIGLTLAGSCALLWGLGGVRPRHVPRLVGLPVGALSGVFGGICNVAGAPLIVYMWIQPLAKRVAYARLQTIFVLASLARVMMLLAAPRLTAHAGFRAVTWSAVGTALTAVPVIVVGGWLGLRIFRRANQAALRRGAYAFVIVTGLVLFGRTRWGERPSGPAASGSAGSRPSAASYEDSSVRRSHP